MNARAVVADEVNTKISCDKIRQGLAQALEIDSQIANARRLSVSMPDKIRQLGLAEKFYIDRRAAVLALQMPALHLGEVSNAYEMLLESCEEKKSSLEGRLLVAEVSGNEQIANHIRREYDEAAREYEILKSSLLAIQRILAQYSKEYTKGCDLKVECSNWTAPDPLGAVLYASVRS